MVPNIGPLLWALIRICVKPIDTRRDISVRLLFNWMCNNNAEYDAVGKSENWLKGGSLYIPIFFWKKSHVLYDLSSITTTLKLYTGRLQLIYGVLITCHS